LSSPKQILTQNGHSRSFKVIYFGIIKEPLRGYITQYNKCGLRCDGSEDIASERSENRHFRPPHSHLTPPLKRTPENISCFTSSCWLINFIIIIIIIIIIKLTLLETMIPGLYFLPLTVLVYHHSNFSGWLRKHVHATEWIIAIHGHFRVNQGRRFWYQSKARIQFPISDQ